MAAMLTRCANGVAHSLVLRSSNCTGESIPEGRVPAPLVIEGFDVVEDLTDQLAPPQPTAPVDEFGGVVRRTDRMLCIGLIG